MIKNLHPNSLSYLLSLFNSNTSKSALRLLNSIQSSALRMVLGAFRTSPNISFCAESAEPLLHFRSLTLTANFFASVAQFPDLPIHTSTLTPHNPLLHSLKSHLHYIPKFNLFLPITSSTPPTIRLDLTITVYQIWRKFLSRTNKRNYFRMPYSHSMLHWWL